jgi:hypothetical protein
MTACRNGRAPCASLGPVVPRRLPLIYLTLLALVTFALRVAWLDTLPRALNFDESVDGLDALTLVRTGWLTPFLQNNFGRETLFLYIQGTLVQMVDVSAFGLRYASVLAGTLAVPMMYAVGRRLALPTRLLPRSVAGTLTGILAATGMAICYWHLFFSRQALRAIVLLPLLLAVVWLLRRAGPALQRGGRRVWGYIALGGLLLGMCQYAYLAARLLPMLFGLPTLVWLMRNRAARRRQVVAMALFWSTALIAALPLILYFVHSPQAFDSRAETIAIPIAESPGGALATNAVRLLLVHFGFGSWLAEWPSLHPLLGLGVLVGLIVCVVNLRRSAAWFSLSWLGVGWLPVLLSEQDWSAITTILRGIVAWPAVCLIGATGWTMLMGWTYRWLASRHTNAAPLTGRRMGTVVILAPAIVLLIGGGATSAHDYFAIWAVNFDAAGSFARPLTAYLNNQTDRLTLCPNRFCAEAAAAFLLQGRYPSLVSVAPEEIRARIAARPAAYLLPRDGEMPSAWQLLDPNGSGQGVAYLLPQLTDAETARLATYAAHQPREGSIFDDRGEVVADVLTLDADVAGLWSQSLPLQPVDALFDGTIRLIGFGVQPAVAKHGERVTLRLAWQAERPIDGDFDVFIHFFHAPSGRRVGQINESLGSAMLLPGNRWAAGVSVVDLHTFNLPPDAPEGAYRFEVGLYHRTSLARLPVTAADTTAATADSIVLGKCRVQDRPPPPPAFAVSVPFEDNVALIGLDLVPAGSGRVSIVLHWQAVGAVTGDYTVFVHLLDQTQGMLVEQQDNKPLRGTYPTWLWSAGEVILDPYDLKLPTDTDDGRYVLRIGLYDASTGERVKLRDREGDHIDLFLRLTNGRPSLSEVAS